MEYMILNDAFRQSQVSRLITFISVTNLYAILSFDGTEYDHRSELPDKAFSMLVAIKADTSTLKYAIQAQVLSSKPVGASEVVVNGVPYYTMADISGFENNLWNSIYVEFISPASPSGYSVDTISIVSAVKNDVGALHSAVILTATELSIANFNDSVIFAQSSFPVIDYDMTVEKTIAAVIKL